MQATYTAGSVDYEALQRGIAQLKIMTDGRIDITLHPGGELVGYFDMLTALGEGVIDVAESYSAFFGGLDPGFSALASGFGVFAIAEPEDTITWMEYYGGRELYTKAYADYNVQFVGTLVGAPEAIMSTKALRTIDDFKGLKIRTPGGLTTALFTSLGSAPVSMGGGEIYTALDTGLVDAAEWLTVRSDWDLGLHEVTDYVLFPSFHQPPTISDISVNMDEWNKLPDDLKAIFMAFVDQTEKYYLYSGLAASHQSLNDMIAYGLEHIVLPPAEMSKAQALARQAAEEWRTKSPMAEEVISSQIAFAELLRK